MLASVRLVVELGEDVDGGERHALRVGKHHLLLANLVVAVAAHAAVIVRRSLLVAEAGPQRFVELLLVAAGGGLVDPVLGPVQLFVGAEETSERRRGVADVESHSYIHWHHWAGHC